MLRWLQSTVQSSGGYGGSAIRWHFVRKQRSERVVFLGSVKLKSSVAERPMAGVCAGTKTLTVESSTVQAFDGRICFMNRALASSDWDTSASGPGGHVASNEETGDLDNLLRYLSDASTELQPQTLANLYQAVAATSQMQWLTATHFSTLIGLFGASSLPPDAPPMTHNYPAVSTQSSGSYWSNVLAVAQNKQSVGYQLNDGDHFWVMWAWIARFRDREVEKTSGPSDALLVASSHYHHIWRNTKVPDVLVPYFDALLSSGDSRHKEIAMRDLLGVLAHHSNLHGRFLQLLWSVFLSFADKLSTSMKADLFQALWQRLSMKHTPEHKHHYMATHMYNPLTKRHERLALNVAQLVATLGAPIFPFFAIPVPASVTQWANRQLRDVLSPTKSIDSRWAAFSVLALHHSVRNGSSDAPFTFDTFPGEQFHDWHVVLTLAILEDLATTSVFSSQTEQLQSILHALWARWKDLASVDTDRPIFVLRAITSAFLRLATRTRDAYIWRECHRYSIDHALWTPDPKHTAADRAQIAALIGDHVEASIRCGGQLWPEIFRSLQSQAVPGPSLIRPYSEVIVRQFLSRDVEIAHEVHEFCAEHDMPLDMPVTTLLAVALAQSRADSVFPMLNLGFNLTQLERVLSTLMDSLRVQRRPYIAPTSGHALSRALLKLLESRAIKRRLKYPLRYSLPLLISANCASDATRTVELVHKRKPSFFSARFLHRLLRILLRHRQHHLAVRLHAVVKSASRPLRASLRRKLTAGLIRSGASSLVTRQFRRSRFNRFRSGREEMMQRLRYRRGIPDRSTSMRVLSILRQKPDHVPSIKDAFHILVRSKRPVEAQRLFRRSLPHLDQHTRTWFGNIYLHRIVRRSGTRNLQAIDKLLRTRKYLAENFGFVGDRVTLNIFVQAMLRWKNVSSADARSLFDDMIRNGYPAAPRWRKVNNVPFGSRHLTNPSLTLDLSTLSPHISFERHVRPLYKIFIKAFYARNDGATAKAIIGILKHEEAEALSGQQHRNRARFEGLRKRNAPRSGRK